MTPFEKHLRVEIEKQAKRLKEMEGTTSYESGSRLLKALIKVYDEYQKMRIDRLVR